MRVPRPALAVVALLVLPALASVPSAAPPPEGVCGVCGSSFEHSAASAGVDATVLDSDLAIDIDDDGNSRWTAHVTLDEASAERFAANRTLLERVVDRTYESTRTVVDDPQDRSVAMEGRTLTVTFTRPDAAHRQVGGVWLFDAFVQSPGDGAPFVDADRITVTGPPDTAVTRAPDGGTVDGNRIVWTGDEKERYGPRIGRPHLVAFAPDDGAVGQATTAVVVRTFTLQRIAPALTAYALVPAALLGVLALGLLLAGHRLPQSDDAGRTTAKWIGIGVAWYAALAGVGTVALDEGLGYVLGGVGVALVPPTVATLAMLLLFDRVEPEAGRRASTAAILAIVGWTFALVLGAPASALLAVVLAPVPFLPFGVLAGANRPSRFLFPAIAALGPVVAAVPLVHQSGIVFVTPAMLTLHSMLSGLLGVALFLVGRRLGAAEITQSDDAGTPDAAST